MDEDIQDDVDEYSMPDDDDADGQEEKVKPKTELEKIAEKAK